MRKDKVLQFLAMALAIITIFDLLIVDTCRAVDFEAPVSCEAIDDAEIMDIVPATEATEVAEDAAEETIPPFEFVEQITQVPLYFQTDYASAPYGRYGTVASHGCGITSVAMVFSYLLDREIMPDELAEEFGRYNTKKGSCYTLFPNSAEAYELSAEQTYNWDDVVTALKEGHVVISNCTKNIFTKGGHYVVLYGITEDGKILVRDPYKYNYPQWNEWCSDTLKDGFAHGFEQKELKYSGLPCWIYPLKDIRK